MKGSGLSKVAGNLRSHVGIPPTHSTTDFGVFFLMGQNQKAQKTPQRIANDGFLRLEFHQRVGKS